MESGADVNVRNLITQYNDRSDTLLMDTLNFDADPNYAQTQELLDLGADIHATNNYGCTVLHNASSTGGSGHIEKKAEILSMLLS